MSVVTDLVVLGSLGALWSGWRHDAPDVESPAFGAVQRWLQETHRAEFRLLNALDAFGDVYPQVVGGNKLLQADIAIGAFNGAARDGDDIIDRLRAAPWAPDDQVLVLRQREEDHGWHLLVIREPDVRTWGRSGIPWDGPSNSYRLSSGRRLYAHAGVLGLTPDRALTYGYDGTIETEPGADADERDGPDPPFTPDEQREIAGFMVAQWQAWAIGRTQ